MSLQRVPLNNFRGGLNTRDSPFELQPNESPDLLNVTISALVGQLESRKGTTRLDTAGMPAADVDFAKQVVIGNGKRFLMLSINGGIYACKPTGEVIKLFAGTAGSIWDFELYSDAAFKDWVYCGNGVDAMQKWDGEAAATVAWPATLGTIPKGGVLCVWENRMFISFVSANVQRVFFSEFGDPEATIKEYGFVDVRGPEDDLDAIQDLAVLGARLIVLKRRDIFFISSSVSMLNRRIGGPGVYSRFQVAELEDKLYFLNPQGIFSTGGAQVEMESGSINNYFPQKVNQAQLAKARLVATKDTYPRLLVTVPTEGAASNNKLIEMIPHINFRRIGGRRYLLLPAFMLHSIVTTMLATWNPTGNQETVVGAVSGTALPVSTMPSQVAVDTFNRAGENPLSNAGKWTAWQWLNGVKPGKVAEILGKKGWTRIASENWDEGARWNPAEFTNPQTSIEITQVGSKEGGKLRLNFCYDPVVQSGYQFIVKLEKQQGGLWEIKAELWKLVAGLATLLHRQTVEKALEPGCKFGTVVAEGKIHVWFFNGTSWSELWEPIADATYIKGYSGFDASDGTGAQWLFNNFAVNALAPTSKLSTLFSGETDEGAHIEAHWQSAWIGIQSEEPFERLRRLNVELSGDAFVDVFKDFESEPAFTQLLPQEGERKEYNEPTGAGLAYRFTRVRPEVRGRFHAVRFRSDAEGLPFLINTAEMAVRGGKEH
jgi:hypothetical protein